MNKKELMAAIMNGSGAKRPSEKALKRVFDYDLSIAPGDSSILIYSRERGTMVLHEPSDPSHVLQHLLLEAASKNDLQRVLHFLNKGVPIEVKDSLGYTALMLAAKNGHIDIVNALSRAGAKIDNTNKGGTTALLLALQQGHIDVMNTLLANGANIGANGNNAVGLRTASKSSVIVQATLNAGLAVDARDWHHYTSLLYAAQQGCIEVVRMLLDAGADIEAQAPSGETALITACRYGRTDTVKELLIRGANKDVKDLSRSTALMTAIQYRHDQIT